MVVVRRERVVRRKVVKCNLTGGWLVLGGGAFVSGLQLFREKWKQ